MLTHLAKPGLAILTFLPGIAEMHGFEQQITLLECAAPLRVVILHGSFPADGRVDVKMPFMECTAILGTNLVESSVTLPDVAIVIDLGGQRHVIEDTLEGRKEFAVLWI